VAGENHRSLEEPATSFKGFLDAIKANEPVGKAAQSAENAEEAEDVMVV
jgi:hypothetical protein